MTTTTDQCLYLDDGRRLAWSECGTPNGRPVIWFHGSPGSRLDAAPDGLSSGPLSAAGIRLIAADRPGYGGSTRLAGHSLDVVADDTCTLADALGIDRFAVIGWSGGASAALATAARLPSRVTAVGVLAGVAPPRLAPHARLAEQDLLALAEDDPAALLATLGELAALMRVDPAAAASEMLGAHLSPPDLAMVTEPAFAASMARSLAEAAARDLTGYADDLQILGRDWPFDLTDIRQPVIVVHGNADLIVPIDHGRAIADSCPDAALRETDDGHLSVVMHAVDLATTLQPQP